MPNDEHERPWITARGPNAAAFTDGWLEGKAAVAAGEVDTVRGHGEGAAGRIRRAAYLAGVAFNLALADDAP